MKKDIYLVALGVGLGLMVSGMTLKVFPVEKETAYTDEEIVEKAKALGMVGIKEHIEKNREKAEEKSEKANLQNSMEETEKTVEILEGDSNETISNKLYEAGIIKDKASFSDYIVEKNAQNDFKAGSYTIRSESGIDELLRLLTSKSY